MSYVNRKSRVFLNRGLRVIRRRSESRLKKYGSSIDMRNWGGVVEERRQHIVELVTKDIQKCLGKLIPVEVIVDALMASLNTDICKLENCLLQLWKFIESVNLNPEQKQNFAAMKQRMKDTCRNALEKSERDCMARRENKAVTAASPAAAGPSGGGGGGTYKVTADAQAKIITRMQGVRPEIGDEEFEKNKPKISGGGTYKVTSEAPGRVVTRIKGVRPGAQLSSGKQIGSITLRAQPGAKVKTMFKNVYPKGGGRGGRGRRGSNS